MGKINKDIKDLSKEAGGKVKARKSAEKWFANASKSVKDHTVSKHSKPFKTGMIHVFRYEKPKHMKTLPWWDMNPVVLGQIKSSTGRSKENNAKTQSEIKLIYKDIVKFLVHFGFDFAIRQYIPELKKNQKVVSYESWAKIALCDFQDLNGIGINEVKKAFREHLKTRSKRKDI